MKTPMNHGGFSTLRREAIAAVSKETFEELCEALVRFEASQRHDGYAISGGAGESVKDGGRDILLEVKRTPPKSKLEFQRAMSTRALTEDAKGRTAYSCKASTDWLNLALRDAKDGMERAIEVLDEGGHFKLCVNVPAKLDTPVKRGEFAVPLQHLLKAIRLRLKNPDSPLLEDRVEIIDGGDLHDYLVNAKPTALLERFAEALSLVRNDLYTFAEWHKNHDHERADPPFQEDDERVARRAELTLSLTQPPRDRTALIVGASGIGKTRFLLWALEADHSLRDRVRVASSYSQAKETLESNFVAGHPDAILVVDDCSVDDAHSLASLFPAKTAKFKQSRLVVLVPTVETEKLARLPCIKLESLDAAACAKLVSNLAPRLDPEDVDRVVELSNGFAWFAVLLAREAHEEKRAPASFDQAVSWALASRHEGAAESLETTRLERCMALAAIALRKGFSDPDGHDEREALAAAVGLASWASFTLRRNECAKRGTLRTGLGGLFSYVTPLILERAVLNRLFGPHGPDGGGKKLLVIAPKLYASLVERADELDHGVAGAIADTAVRLLQGVGTLAQLDALDVTSELLALASRHRPRQTATNVRRLVDAATLEEIRSAPESRRSVLWALSILVRHGHAFEDAEVSLFRLAIAAASDPSSEALSRWREVYGETPRAGWQIGDRVGLLRRRLEPGSEDSTVTMEAIEALLDGVSRWQRRLEPEAIGAMLTAEPAWTLLADASRSPSAPLAAAARKIAINSLRGAVRGGLGTLGLDAVRLVAPDLDPSERILLRNKLAEISAYDLGFLHDGSEAFERLRELLEPRTFGDRLRDKVSRYPRGVERDTSERDAQQLAEEGVSPPVPLLAELDWLMTPEAKRARPFLWAVGRADRDGVCLGALLARARGPRAEHLVSGYLGGLRTGSPTRFEAVLRELIDERSRTSLVILMVVDMPIGPDEIALLVDLLDRAPDDWVLGELGRGVSSRSPASSTEISTLVRKLLEMGRDASIGAALEILDDVMRERTGDFLVLADLAVQALSLAAKVEIWGSAEHYWEEVALTLVARGRAKDAARAAMEMLSRDRGSAHGVWPVIVRAFEQDARGSWEALAQALDQPNARAISLAFRWWGMVLPIPTDDALVWVSDSAHRAALAANLVSPFRPNLPELLRELIRRFGANSSPARVIASRMFGTQGVVKSIASDAAARLDYARAWAKDDDAEVAQFGSRIAQQLEADVTYHAAYEEAERRRYGT